MYPYQTTMRTMVGRITNQFAEREKVSQKCGAEAMEQCVTLVSCLSLEIPPSSESLDFLSKSKILRFFEKWEQWDV